MFVPEFGDGVFIRKRDFLSNLFFEILSQRLSLSEYELRNFNLSAFFLQNLEGNRISRKFFFDNIFE